MTEIKEFIQIYLQYLDVTSATDYSLWKVIKSLNDSSSLICRFIRLTIVIKSDSDKVNTFAEHLSGLFTPNPNEATS